MTRLDSAIDAIETALADLAKALKERDDMTAPPAEQASQSPLAEEELQAMKSELNEAMTLLKAIQDVPNNQEG